MKMKSIFYFVVLGLCVNVIPAKAQVNVQDSLALVDLYNSTDGPHWKNQTNWLTSSPLKKWHGITVTNERVAQISLRYNNLAGNIPSTIGNLVNLTDFRLDHNELKDAIPSSFGNLVNLTILELGDNQLSGNIPASLGNLVNLLSLHLNNNQLSGSIPSSIGNLVNLIWLYLNNNQLSGSIPSAIGNLVNLHWLYLYNNQLSGNIPSSINNLGYLEALVLSNNQLNGSVPSLSNLGLGELNLSNNQLSGSIVFILNDRNLTSLSLSNNQFSDSIPSSLGYLSLLERLDLSNNRLSGSIPSSIGNLIYPCGCWGIQDLNLSHNRLSDTIPSSLGNLEFLEGLDLSNNQLSGSIPSSFRNLHSLIRLHLDSNHFTFDGMELVEQNFFYATYDHQKNIPVTQNGNTLSVSAGGTLSNNTYKLLKWNGPSNYTLVATNYGDSVFHPAVSGKYQVKILNSVATGLVLYSKVIDYAAPANPLIASSENGLQQSGKTNLFRVYPNPAKDILHVETNGNASFSLLDQSGKIYLITNINSKGSINISNMSAGLYYLRNNSTKVVQKVVIER